ncbi:probable transporter Mch2p [[Candida] railenensis]|uniref:Probable transporter Mch2p n=1 Tax=[Candida] railenensis TaxID=45579 RepID=A0A9P0QTT6_9ASCO|nr:probable transporter Mch2p [[Candida] railenensis]
MSSQADDPVSSEMSQFSGFSEEKSKTVEEKTDNAPKDIDGGYGWVVVFAAFIIFFSTWGMNTGYAVYFAYYVNSNHFDSNISLFQYSAVGGLSVGLGACFAPVINYTQGKLGTRQTIMLGGLIQFAASILASFAVNYWQLALTQGVLQSFGLAFASIPTFTLIPQWFVKKRVLANAIGATGSCVGGVVFNLSLEKIIEVRSVNWALRAQGIITVFLIALGALLVKTKTKAHKIEFSIIDFQVIKNFGFLVFCFYSMTVMFGYVIVLYCLSDFTVSLGYTQSQGSIVSTISQVGMCVGRPLAGYLSDRYGACLITASAYIFATIFTLAMWVNTKNYSTALALAFLLGLFIGTVFSTSAPIVARLVGLPKMNIGFSMMLLFWGVAGIFSQLIGTSLTSGHSSTQYQHTAIFAGCVFFASAIAIVILRGYIIARDELAEQLRAERNSNDEEKESYVDILNLKVPASGIIKKSIAWYERRI